MHNVLRSVFVASLVSMTVSSASYALLAQHDDTIQGVAKTLVPRVLPEEAMAIVLPVVPQAAIFLISLVTGVLGFAVAFITIGTYLSANTKVQTPVSGTK